MKLPFTSSALELYWFLGFVDQPQFVKDHSSMILYDWYSEKLLFLLIRYIDRFAALPMEWWLAGLHAHISDQVLDIIIQVIRVLKLRVAFVY
jgi:hypothetical protein